MNSSYVDRGELRLWGYSGGVYVRPGFYGHGYSHVSSIFPDIAEKYTDKTNLECLYINQWMESIEKKDWGVWHGMENELRDMSKATYVWQMTALKQTTTNYKCSFKWTLDGRSKTRKNKKLTNLNNIRMMLIQGISP